jgi:hypothetical protein
VCVCVCVCLVCVYVCWCVCRNTYNNIHKNNFDTLFYINTTEMRVKKKQKGEAVPDVEKMRRTENAMQWYQKHRIVNPKDKSGRWNVRPSWISPISDLLRARDLKESHVITMMAGYCTYGVIAFDCNVRLVMLCKTQEECDAINLDLTANKPPHPMEPFVGAHSSTGLTRLNKAWPNNKSFVTINSEIIACVETEENIRMIKYLGTLDNTVKAIREDMSMWDCVKQMHNSLIHIAKRHPKDPSAQKKLWKEVKEDCEAGMPFTGGSFQTCAALAKSAQPVWLLVEQIFSGQFKLNKDLKGQKTPTALTHFNAMGNIAQENLTRWLTRVVEGQWTTAMFSQRCHAFKKSERVASEIIEYVNTMNFHAFQTSDEMCEVYPAMGTDCWFANVMEWTPNKKGPGPSAFIKDLIDKVVEKQKLGNQQAPEVSLAVLYVSFHCSFLH